MKAGAKAKPGAREAKPIKVRRGEKVAVLWRNDETRKRLKGPIRSKGMNDIGDARGREA
jgi:hypothetical protein